MLPAKRLPVGALGLKLALNDHLCGDPRVIGAYLPQRVMSAHTVVANEGIHDGLLEAVPHVQRARDIGWRDRNTVGGSFSGWREIARRFPLVIPACSMSAGEKFLSMVTLLNAFWKSWVAISHASLAGSRGPCKIAKRLGRPASLASSCGTISASRRKREK